MKNKLFGSIFVLSAFAGGLYYFSFQEPTIEKKEIPVDLTKNTNSENNLIKKLNEEITNLKLETKILKNTVAIYKEGIFNIKQNSSKENIKLNIEHIDEELDRLEKEKSLFISKSLPLSDIKEEVVESNYLFDVKAERTIKFSIMEVGRWDLTRYEIEDIEKTFSKDKAIYEITPIVDNKKYLNDPDELKQLGISRKRAGTAVDVLKELNSENKVFISDEVITSETERGFIIKRINFK